MSTITGVSHASTDSANPSGICSRAFERLGVLIGLIEEPSKSSQERAQWSRTVEENQAHRTRISSTATDVGASVRVMDLLGNQLNEVVKDIETSVVGVCQGFQSMAQRAQSAISAASETLEVTGHDSDRGLVGNVQTILETLLSNVKSSSQYAVELSSRLDALDHRLRSVEKSLDEVEEMSAKARIVALNGQIEAARLGTAGMAFGVVAEETKVLADNAAKTSDTIRQLVTSLGESLIQAAEDLRHRTVTDSTMVARSEADVRCMLEELSRVHRRMTDSLQNSNQVGQALRQDIAKAVTSMQFQDRVSQRVAHVVETMHMLAHELQPIVAMADPVQVNSRTHELTARLQSRYTMDAERQVHEGQTHSTAASNECSVELF